MAEDDGASGRVAQRRRTRKAIVDATAGLISAGVTPSIADVAEAADVSRRTVYMYFPTLDQLLLDATLGAMNSAVDTVLDQLTDDDPRVRIERLVSVLVDEIADSLPLGRMLIRLTVDQPASDAMPKRGYRRVRWIEQAIEPLRDRLGRRRFERLVSALSMVIGWEAFIVLFDVRGLSAAEARRVVRSSALALVDAATAEVARAEA